MTGTAETSRLSPRNGFTTYFVLSPVSGVDCHRCLRDTSRKIDATVAAPGPHDFAVRRLRSRPAVNCLTLAASIASRAQRFVTIAIRPLVGAGCPEILPICGIVKWEVRKFRNACVSLHLTCGGDRSDRLDIANQFRLFVHRLCVDARLPQNSSTVRSRAKRDLRSSTGATGREVRL